MPPETGPADPDDAALPGRDDQPPAPTPAPTRTPPPTPTPTPTEPITATKAREDTDVGWGDYADPVDDDRLLRDRPPHWDNA